MKRVAVVTATRNRAGSHENPGYLGPCICSVSVQDYDSHVHIIVDDGSTDATKELVSYHASKDPRIMYIRRDKPAGERETASLAQNMGIDAVMDPEPYPEIRGALEDIEYVTMLHSDDLLPPGSLSRRVNALGEVPKAGCAYGHILVINSENNVIRKISWDTSMSTKKSYKKLLGLGWFPHHTLLWRKNFLGEIGLFEPDMSWGEDLDMTLSTMEHAMSDGYTLVGIKEHLYYYRRHGDTVTTWLDSAGGRKADVERIKERHPLTKHWTARTKGFIRRPHLLLPDPLKSLLRPVRDRCLRAISGRYEDKFLAEMTEVGSEFWKENKL